MGNYPFRPDFRMREGAGGPQNSGGEIEGVPIAEGGPESGEEKNPRGGSEVFPPVNPGIQRLDRFFSNSIDVLNHIADTMEKGDELNKAIERVVSALVKLLLENPVIKAIIELLKELVTKKTIEAISKSSESKGTFQELVSTVMESPAVKELIVEMVGKQMAAGMKDEGGLKSEFKEEAPAEERVKEHGDT